MNSITTLLIPIEPVPKGRPRFTRFGKPYTPKKTADYERIVADTYRTTPNANYFGDNEPLKVSLIFCMPIPKSYPKKRREWILKGYESYTKKPDCDNLAKAVLDALNGVAFEDDSQIVELHIRKEYAEQPHVWVSIQLAV